MGQKDNNRENRNSEDQAETSSSEEPQNISRREAIKSIREKIPLKLNNNEIKPSEIDTDGHISRRQFLQLMGLGAGGALAASSGIKHITDSKAFGQDRKERITGQQIGPTQNTVNIVEEGADNNGNETIDNVLESVADDNTTIEFPEGRYLLEGPFRSEYSNLRLVGNNATLVPTDRDDGGTLLDIRGAGNVIEGFEYDVRDCEYPPRIDIQSSSWELKKIVFRGEMNTRPHDMDSDQHGISAMRPAVTDPSGTGLIQDVYMQDGAAPGGVADNRRGMLVNGGNHRGLLRINRVWMENWAENTIYGNNFPGELIIENSFFRNTNVGIRIGGDTTVRNCVVVQDDEVPLAGWSKAAGMRAVWLQNYDMYDSGGGPMVVEDCDFKLGPADTGLRWAIAVTRPTEKTVFRNCRIEYHYSGHAPFFLNNGPTHLTLENIHLTTSQSYYPAFNIQGNISGYGEISGCVDAPSDASISNDSHIRNNMERGSCEKPDTTPPLPPPPPEGQAPTGGGSVELESAEITIRGGSGGNPRRYMFFTNGRITKQNDSSTHDSVFVSKATGTVAGDEDSYEIYGKITDFQAQDGITVVYNGQEMTAQEFRNSDICEISSEE